MERLWKQVEADEPFTGANWEHNNLKKPFGFFVLFMKFILRTIRSHYERSLIAWEHSSVDCEMTKAKAVSKLSCELSIFRVIF